MLNKIIYYWLHISGYTLGKLPLWFTYLCSDIVYFFMYKIYRYRVKVTRVNLRASFPEKTEKELHKIEKEFYKHFIDVMLESLSMIGISESNIKKRFTYTNSEVFNNENKKHSMICAMAHYGSWEFSINYSLYSESDVLAVYHKLSSKSFDRFYCKMRSRFGVKPIPMQSIARVISKHNHEKITVALIADQDAPMNKEQHWIDFLSQKTIFYRGMEKLAVKYNMGIMYLNVRKIKRGYYEATFIPMHDPMDEIKPFEITEKYAHLLEENIREYPHLWLWTHKRWKANPTGTNIYKQNGC